MNNNINILVSATLDKNASKNNINSALASLKTNKLKLEATVDIDETKKNIASAIEKSKIRQIKLLGKLDIAKTRANINAQLKQFKLENQITLSTNIKASPIPPAEIANLLLTALNLSTIVMLSSAAILKAFMVEIIDELA